jgi:hypothetical protein
MFYTSGIVHEFGSRAGWHVPSAHAGAECVDLLFKWARVEIAAAQGGASEDTMVPGPPPPRPLTAAERAAVQRSAPPDIAAALRTATDATAAATSKVRAGVGGVVGVNLFSG